MMYYDCEFNNLDQKKGHKNSWKEEIQISYVLILTDGAAHQSVMTK